MCIYIYIYIYTHTHTHTHTRMGAHTHVYTCMCIYLTHSVTDGLQWWWVSICLEVHKQGFFLQWRAEWSLDSWSNLTLIPLFLYKVMMIALLRSLRSLPCSQQQTRSSWSLLHNAGPPSFQSSGEILSTPAALLLHKCSMALVISFIEGSSSEFCFEWLLGDSENCWVLDDTVSAKAGLEVLRPMTQNGGLVCKKHLPICTAQGTLDGVSWTIHWLEGFVEIGPPLILDLLKLALEDAANEMEGNPPHRTRWLNQVGLVGWFLH